MAKSGFAKESLKNYVDRLVALENEKSALSEDIKEVKSEAKASGFDTKIVQKIVNLTRLDRADIQEQDAIEDLYRTAYGLPSLSS